MKKIPELLATLGIILLLLALVGRFLGNPARVAYIRITTVVLFANTAFLLAILSKLLEKK
ncbi:MAG: hypothetical protein JW788_03460 [Candidatus Omnitrophica bacterium]|nr:hypothetical protein [Candidatus Omnitrophota bacterium]